jgi:protoporphyrinogen oxidase
VFINHTKLTGKDSYNGKNVYYLGAYLSQEDEFFKMKDDEIQKAWFEKLKLMVPEFRASSVDELKIFRFKNAQHIVGTAYRKQLTENKTPIRNVYLANFSQIYPFDRGVNRAVRQARELVNYLGK